MTQIKNCNNQNNNSLINQSQDKQQIAICLFQVILIFQVRFDFEQNYILQSFNSITTITYNK